jgi:uncharacterized Zn finger protein
MEVKIEIRCPNCNIGQDVHLIKRENYEWLDAFYSNIVKCPNCEHMIDVTLSSYEERELPF